MSATQIAWLGIVAATALGLAVVSHIPAVPAPITVALVPLQGATSAPPQASSPPVSTQVRPRAAQVKSPTGVLPLPVAPSQASSAQSAATAAVASTPRVAAVMLTIIDPEGQRTLSVDLKQGADACEILAEAKAEGRLRSLTLDDSYKSSFGSSYVREINGYSNNWTFTVNGVKPLGCSLSTPKEGDSIVWTFGAGD